MLPTTPRDFSRSMKISTTWSSSRMATRVSWSLEEMIISLFMENAPACDADVRRRDGAVVPEPGEQPGKAPRDGGQHQERHAISTASEEELSW
jgi:hypothetical protein